MAWHSRLLPEVQPDLAPADAIAGKALWISHGTADNVIPLAAAQPAQRSLSHIAGRIVWRRLSGRATRDPPAELEQSAARELAGLAA